MPRAADTRRPSAGSLVPMGIVAAAILILALLVSGGRTGTIVVQRITWTATGLITTTSSGGFSDAQPLRTTVTSVVETSADGTPFRSLVSSSNLRPGFQQVTAGDAVALYDPTDNTIYETTEPAWQHALDAQFKSTTPNGSLRTSVTLRVSHVYPSFEPGATSVAEQQLRAGLYRVGRRTTIDGRAALELLPTHATIRLGPQSRETFEPVYVTPRTRDPIEEVVKATGPGQRTSTVVRWLTYRVLPATSANLWRLSLRALHPRARIVHGASGFIQASNASSRTGAVPSG